MGNGLTRIKIDPNETHNIRFKGVSKNQLKLLKTGKLPFALFLGLFVGNETESFFQKDSDDIRDFEEDESKTELVDLKIDEEAAIDTDRTNGTDDKFYDYEVPTHVEFASNVNDEMSFGEAFRAAREQLGAGGFFNWRGASYHTHTKEEWEEFSDADKQHFYERFQENTLFAEGTFEEMQEIETVDITEDMYFPNKEIDVDDYVELAEIGTTDDILEGLNDGNASSEEDVLPEDFDV